MPAPSDMKHLQTDALGCRMCLLQSLGAHPLPSLSMLHARGEKPGNELKHRFFPQTMLFAAAVCSNLDKQNANSASCSDRFLPLMEE